MKKLATLTAFLLAVMMVFSGCSMIRINEERDDAVVVATVNGVPLYKGEYKDLYEQYVNYLGLDESTTTAGTMQESMDVVRQSLLDMMAEQEVTWQMIEEFGFSELTEEEEKKNREQLESVIELAMESYLVDEEGNPIENPTEEQRAEARARILADFGVPEEQYLEDLRRSACQQKLYDELTDMASVTVDEVQAEYERLVSEDQASYQGNEALYEQAVMGGSVVLYVPAGLRYIKHVLVAFGDEAAAELAELRNAEAIAEDPEAAAAETDARRAELAKEIETEAKDVLAKIESGEWTFEEAMTEVSDDTQDPESEGFIIASSGESYDTEFVTSAFKIKNAGEHSDLILTDFGYHIILYSGDVKPGPKTLDDTVKYGYDEDMNIQTMTVFEYVETRMIDEQKDTLFDAAIDLAVKDADIKTYIDRVRDVK